MYIKDGIAYAGEQKPVITVKSIRPMDGYRLWLRFSTGEEKEYDCTSLLETSIFSPLKKQEVFNGVYLEYGVPVWMDGAIDVAPERLYEDGYSI